MDSFVYDNDIENYQQNMGRLALTEESLNRTLLYDERKNNTNNYCLLMYTLAGLIIVICIILIIVAYKHLI
jgi:hypothetical protein